MPGGIKRHKEVFVKLKGKYTGYHGICQDLRSRHHVESDVRALREDLKKRDEELM